MPVTHLNLEDFPDSAYAHELRGGAARFKFAAPLEAQYVVAHLRRVRLRVRIWFSLNVVLACAFTFAQVHRTGLWNAMSLAHVGALAPCTIVMAWLVWSRHYERFFMSAAPALITISCALIAVFIARDLAAGQYEQLAPLAVHLFAIFFFTGLMFRQSLVIAAVVYVASAAACFAAGLAPALILKCLVVLTLTAVIAAIVYRDVEQSYRTNFLEGALIGELVARDGLSGLMNRRAFDEHLLRVWQHALRDQRSIAVLMIDIDHFKSFNDDFGHQAGDLALRKVAQIVKGFARRPLDLAARYGGEEFAVILYDLAVAHVSDTAERLRDAVQNLPMEREVTVSVGVGIAAPTIGRTPEGAVQLADQALYEAKKLGRNRVAVSGVEAYMLLETGAFDVRRRGRRLR
jgi:diguanylate cyclase (GGDEF)-like protein